jgi:hypothetical protein
MPVDVSSRTGAVRRPAGPEIWTCPNCAAENTSVISQGCPACGAGKPGQKAQKPSGPATEVDKAFDEWFRPLAGSVGTAEAELMRKAFTAGWEMSTPTVTLTPRIEEPLTGTPETRTLKAALQFFIDNVLDANPEEVVSGEWLSADAARNLLARIG